MGVNRGLPALAGAALLTSMLAGCGDAGSVPDPRTAPTAGTSDVRPLSIPSRRIASYGVEVSVPNKWGLDYASVLPGCIVADGDYTDDTWARDVPRAPYVQVGAGNQVVPAIGCIPQRSSDVPTAFGELPYDLWQPYVDLSPTDRRGAPAGVWRYRSWTLTRRIVGPAAVTVLARRSSPALGSQVVKTARRVAVDVNGCSSLAPVELTGSGKPAVPPMPDPSEISGVSICQYDRTAHGRAPMIASRRITGDAARSLVSAIAAAPSGGGPDTPQDCLATEHGDQALVLHFTLSGGAGDPQAFVYSDWCVHNGIFDSAGSHALTTADCRPLYAQAPVRLWSTQGNLAPLCMTD